MELGMVGLGKMGGYMTTRLLERGQKMVVYDRSAEAVQRSADEGATPAESLGELVEKLTAPRIVWCMVPAGAPTDSVIEELSHLLSEDDVLLDGGNSNYKDTIRRSATLEERKIHFVDVGTSGGVWGLTEGYSMMIGGKADVVERLRPIFESLAPAPDRGWGRVGPTGAGHFVKMIHNGIEYGLMQAYAEGFEVMANKKEFGLDLGAVAEIWRHGSVVRSWLLDLTASALKDNPELDGIKGWVADSGEGRWTVAEAIDLDVPAPIMTLALQMRFVSRQEDGFAAKMLAAMRNQFGGHDVKKEP
jgi:6-phosphogluconate dehydrogenase